jgi:hypothetical protein
MSIDRFIRRLRPTQRPVAVRRRRQDNLHWALQGAAGHAPIGPEVSDTPASMSLSNIAAPNDDTAYTTSDQIALGNLLREFRDELQSGNGRPVFMPHDGLTAD